MAWIEYNPNGVRQSTENRSGVDGDFASHKSTAICWRYKKAKGITKKRAAPLWCCPFLYSLIFSPHIGQCVIVK